MSGADEPVCGAAHLTLPTLRLGPSLSPLKGGEGLVSAGIILVDASRAIKFSSPDSLALMGEGLGGGGAAGLAGDRVGRRRFPRSTGVVAHKIGKIAAELHLATELVSLRLTRAQGSPEPPRSCSAVKCEFAHLRRRRDVSSFLDVRGGKHHPLPTLPHQGGGLRGA